MPSPVNKYYNGVFSFAQKATERDVLQGKELSGRNIEDLCAGFLTNAIYANVVEGGKNFEQGREEAFKVAAQVVIKHGEEIEKQLNKNDGVGLTQNSDREQLPNNPDQPNTSKDVKKISGGTMAQIIAKIAEIIASLPLAEQNSAAQNFSALFSVLGKSFDDKIGQTMQALAETPVVVANIKNILEGTEGGKIFDELVEKHLDANQRTSVSNVSKEDLETYRSEKSQQQKNQTTSRQA